jgi:hypothetical protein
MRTFWCYAVSVTSHFVRGNTNSVLLDLLGLSTSAASWLKSGAWASDKALSLTSISLRSAHLETVLVDWPPLSLPCGYTRIVPPTTDASICLLETTKPQLPWLFRTCFLHGPQQVRLNRISGLSFSRFTHGTNIVNTNTLGFSWNTTAWEECPLCWRDSREIVLWAPLVYTWR